MSARRGFIQIIVVAVIGFILGVLSIYLLQKYIHSKQIIGDTLPEIPTKQNPTANWKTYTNTKLGYEINFPENHTPYYLDRKAENPRIPVNQETDHLIIQDNADNVISAEPITLQIYAETTDVTPKQWINNYLQSFGTYPKPNIKIQDTVFNGKKAVEALGGNGGYNPAYRVIVIPNEGYLLIITENMKKPLLDQILSTFKFTN